MTRKIFYDGMNLALTKGTGIATYTRVLLQRAQALGYDRGVLYSTNRKLPKDTLEQEVAFFDSPDMGRLPETLQVLQSGVDYLKSIAPVRASTVELAGSVDKDGLGNRWTEVESICAAPRVFDQARGHSAVFNKLMKVVLPEQADIFHFTYPIPVTTNAAANIYTLHDLIPLRLPYTTLDHKRLYIKALRQITAKADMIVTVSEHSKRDIVELTGIDEERVTNTSQSVELPDHIVNRTDDDLAQELAGLYGLTLDNYFLFYGSLEPKKNLGRTVEAYLAANVEQPLVVVMGQSWLGADEIRLLNQVSEEDQRSGNKRRIVKLEYLPFSMLMSLVKGARGVLFPSLYEGFGLPILEAMSLGTPVVTSNVSSMPEVAGDAAILVNPYRVPELSKAIKILSADEDLCAALSAKGLAQAQSFSNAAYQEKLGKLYEQLL